MLSNDWPSGELVLLTGVWKHIPHLQVPDLSTGTAVCYSKCMPFEKEFLCKVVSTNVLWDALKSCQELDKLSFFFNQNTYTIVTIIEFMLV
ncbi:hypothetical protein chiPu_0015983 [Chiloscyllium punctatum]|uniref:Uncharacterized protein n=1 Tax=Chiloscyllium punctatum TaxID=137246 RepID=A0A401T4A5_CHIPU|nr:hypothetical protein [Chiloscyllium punctatum]